jgi:hypothetical protein
MIKKWLFRSPSHNAYNTMHILWGVVLLLISLFGLSEVSTGLAGLTFVLTGTAEYVPQQHSNLAGYLRIVALVTLAVAIGLAVAGWIGVSI